MSKERELRKISPEELISSVREHGKWLKSQGEEGKKADLMLTDLQGAKLMDANLQKVDLRGANLQRADFRGANLQEADLREADLQNADLDKAILTGADLQSASLAWASLKGTDLRIAKLQDAVLHGVEFEKANVEKAIFKDADLLDAKLKGVLGLNGEQLGGAITTGAELPDAINAFKTPVTEASKMARTIFVSLILACSYCWITIASTSDASLITGFHKTKLPILNIEIAVRDFFLAAPFIILCLFLYFHLYLETIWEGLAGLPAIYPDGRRLDQVEYPWMLNGLVRAYFRNLKSERPDTSFLRNGLVIILAWWFVPITILAFWFRYLKNHSRGGTAIHVLLITAAIVMAVFFQRLCVMILRGTERTKFSWGTCYKNKYYYKLFGISILIVIVLGWPSYSVISGNHDNFFNRVLMTPLNLAGEDLRQSDLSKLDLREADLRGADLSKANLRGADLRKADFRGADLRGVDFRGADLKGANFQWAVLHWAQLQGTDLQMATLLSADFQMANFKGAKVQEEYTIEQLKHARSLYGVKGLPVDVEQLLRKDKPELFEPPQIIGKEPRSD